MTNRELEKKIQSGFEKITPDVLDSVLKDCGSEVPKGQIIVMEGKKKRRPALRFAGIAAALLLLVGGFLGFRAWQINTRVASVISLDVNPSIEIRTNEKEKVLEVVPLNEDGRTITGDMDFSGSSLEVTVNALIGSMLRNGYISELANSILISIENDDAAAASALEQKMMGLVRDLLGDADLEAAILGQVVGGDKAAEEIAKDCGISVGKARLIEVLMAADPKYRAEDLSGLTINELNNLYAAHKTSDDGDGAIDSVGKASTRAYIGEEAAVKIALADAGADEDAVRTDVELDWEDGRMVYDVDLEDDRYEYEYEIDAKTGEILDKEKEPSEKANKDEDGQSQPETIQDDSAPGSLPSSGKITEAEAKQIALDKAGISPDEIFDYHIEEDEEDGRTVYEIEFRDSAHEYEITIDAETGIVLEYEKS